MKEHFVSTNFHAKTLKTIDRANEIIREYQAKGYTLSLRQLYYQFVSRLWIENKQSEYEKLGNNLANGRLAGFVDWSAIEDRGRTLRRGPCWNGPNEIITAVANQYRENFWASQRFRPEVWIEKDALTGVIAGTCITRHRVPYFSCRGRVSHSELYAAGKRFAQYREDGYIPIVFHLADHDPCGIDMTRENREKLAMFSRGPVEVARLGLNIDQVRLYRLPPNTAKENGSCRQAYVEEFGTECWELDALPPDIIDDLVSDAIESIVDKVAWEAAKAKETSQREILRLAAEKWSDVAEFLKHSASGR
jgi:hypothetical protein